MRYFMGSRDLQLPLLYHYSNRVVTCVCDLLMCHCPAMDMKKLKKLVNIKKLLISKRRIGILKKLPKQGEDSESL